MTDERRLDELWNEAVDLGVDGDVPPGTPVGMERLAHALRVHGSVMGGGVGFALEANESFRVSLAVDGFRYLGLTEVADLLAEVADGYGRPGYDASRVAAQTDRIEELLNEDDPVGDAFRAIAIEKPEDFGLN